MVRDLLKSGLPFSLHFDKQQVLKKEANQCDIKILVYYTQ